MPDPAFEGAEPFAFAQGLRDRGEGFESEDDMGEAKERGSREDRLLAAQAREARQRAKWADELVAEGAAILAAAARHAKTTLPEDASEEAVASMTYTLASLAAQRAVAVDLVEAMTDGDDLEDDDEDEESAESLGLAPPKPLRTPSPIAPPAAKPFSLVDKPTLIGPPEPPAT